MQCYGFENLSCLLSTRYWNPQFPPTSSPTCVQLKGTKQLVEDRIPYAVQGDVVSIWPCSPSLHSLILLSPLTMHAEALEKIIKESTHSQTALLRTSRLLGVVCRIWITCYFPSVPQLYFRWYTVTRSLCSALPWSCPLHCIFLPSDLLSVES